MRYILTFLMACLLPVVALAKPIISDLSTNRIEIDSGFTGTELLLFGARNGIGDIVVVVRGQDKNYVVRKKERVAGIWINREQYKLRGVPNYYSIAASTPLATISIKDSYRTLGIGMEDSIPLPPLDKAPFMHAFLKHQQHKQLYNSTSKPISFMGETLFKVPLFFPDTTPEGIYIAETYLISDKEIVAMESTPIRVIKTGFDAAMHTLAHDYPSLYGLIAIALALIAGWSASAIFNRN